MQALTPLRVRGHGVKESTMEYSDRYTPFFRRAGLLPFVTVARRGMPTYNAPALTALVDRWRPETHTFHLPCGEMTVTLEDVAMITALPIAGDAVCGRIEAGRFRDMVEHLLGVRPGEAEEGRKAAKTGGLAFSWLREHFRILPEGANAITTERYARAYLLYVFGAVLFPDGGGDSASWMFLPLLSNWDNCRGYSWGSAALAFLYRQLDEACRRSSANSNLGGCVLLLQVCLDIQHLNVCYHDLQHSYIYVPFISGLDVGEGSNWTADEQDTA